jgi:hypothetical protein
MNPIRNGEIGRIENFAFVDYWLDVVSEQLVKDTDKMMMDAAEEVQKVDLDTRKGAPDLEKCFEVAPRLTQL